MKYEMIFGNQDLFDGAGTFTGLDVVTRSIASGNMMYCRLSDLTPQSLREYPVIAMRRIIQEPKRWTVEDQKAGRLPEVGAELLHESEGYVNFVGEFDFRWMLRTKEGGLYLAEKFYCSPIETPEEKAERLEGEFVNELMKDKPVIYTSSEQLAMCRKTARAVYRKLSGALSVPTKGGE